MDNLVSTYSIWYIPVCILLGAGYAALLYLRERKFEFRPLYRWLLASFRTLSISLIAILLLNPMFRSRQTEMEKPLIIVLQDNSESIRMGRDSAFYTTEFPEVFDRFTDALSTSYEVVPFTFGNQLHKAETLNFTEPATNLGNALDAVYDRYSHKNIGALVLLSDGINNQGLNPLYQDYGFNFPLYTIALGDTTLQRDILLNRINFNRLAYLNNYFPVEINLQGKKSLGATSTLTIERDKKVLFSEKIQFDTPNDFISIRADLQTTEIGVQKFTVKLSPIDGEITLVNNVQDFYIDVLEDKQKILLLAAAPHPDITAMKQAVKENINYELDVSLMEDFKSQELNYDLVILHGLPATRQPMSWVLDQMQQNNIPVLYVITQSVSFTQFNTLQTGIAFNREGLVYNEALPLYNPDFNLFGMSDPEVINTLPPLINPYGNLEVAPTATSLFYQQLGSVKTRQPLWLFHETLDRKTSIILGPGIWKWRLKEYSMNGDFSFFDDLIGKTIQYLALKVDRSLFRVYGKNNYDENEPIEFEAELYNEVYELVNDQEISAVLTAEDGSSYPFTFTQTANAYYLNAGNLPPGSYSYRATVNTGSKTLTESGEFTIRSTKLEQMVTEANHNFLLNLAKKYGGEMVYPNQMEELENTIKTRDDIRTVSHQSFVYTELLNNPYLLGLILLLLTMEWFARKRAGGY